jgi:polyisoprenoid-binding protein YceI
MQRRVLALIAAAVVVILAVAVFIFFPGRGTHSTPTHKAVGAATVVGTPISTSGLDKYTIVAGQSTASYSVHEDLIFGGVGSNTAVGTTSGVSGSFYLGVSGAPTLTEVNISVDLTGLQTDSSLRDGHVQDYLDTSQFPDAVFTSTNVTGLPATYTPGQTITFQITGNLKLHGVTNAETFKVQGKVLSGNQVTGTASTTIFMTDFGVTPPDLANIAIVDNKVTLTIDFTAQK